MTTVQEHPATRGAAAGTIGAATALLDAYRSGTDRFFASPTRTLLARGVHAPVADGERPLPDRVRDALGAAHAEGVHDPLVIGAIPFDPAAPSALVVPAGLRRAPALAADPLTALP
ncbi:isochorismate synthase, partial [Streptomyces sp. G35A]